MYFIQVITSTNDSLYFHWKRQYNIKEFIPTCILFSLGTILFLTRYIYFNNSALVSFIIAIIALILFIIGILFFRSFSTYFEIDLNYTLIKITIIKRQFRFFRFFYASSYSGMQLKKIKTPSSWQWAQFNPVTGIYFNLFDCLTVDYNMKKIDLKIDKLLVNKFLLSKTLPNVTKKLN